jgi:hypothetical protein
MRPQRECITSLGGSFVFIPVSARSSIVIDLSRPMQSFTSSMTRMNLCSELRCLHFILPFLRFLYADAAAALALAPLTLAGLLSLTGFCDLRMAEARATASLRRSVR